MGASKRASQSLKSASTAPASIKRTYSIKGGSVSLYTLDGRITVPLRLGKHQRRILGSGKPKEAELVLRKGRWFFNLAVEIDEKQPVASGVVIGVDVGENILAAMSTGKVFGGERYLALRRRLQSKRETKAPAGLRQRGAAREAHQPRNEQGNCQ